MADDLEKAIIQAYGDGSSQQARDSALEYLGSISASAGGWRSFMEKLFGTNDIQVAVVCLSALSEVVLHRYVQNLCFIICPQLCSPQPGLT
jgi:hypothetical protein